MRADGMIGTLCNRTSTRPVVLSTIRLPHRHDDAKGGACRLLGPHRLFAAMQRGVRFQWHSGRECTRRLFPITHRSPRPRGPTTRTEPHRGRRHSGRDSPITQTLTCCVGLRGVSWLEPFTGPKSFQMNGRCYVDSGFSIILALLLRCWPLLGLLFGGRPFRRYQRSGRLQLNVNWILAAACRLDFPVAPVRSQAGSRSW